MPEKAQPRFPGQTPVCSLESRALGMGQGATLLSAGLLGTPLHTHFQAWPVWPGSS